MTRIEEIRARLEKATSGKWQMYPSAKGPGWYIATEHSPFATLADYVDDKNADLIRNAPSDLTYLLARNAALERVAAAADEFVMNFQSYSSCGACEANEGPFKALYREIVEANLAALDAEGEKV